MPCKNECQVNLSDFMLRKYIAYFLEFSEYAIETSIPYVTAKILVARHANDTNNYITTLLLS